MRSTGLVALICLLALARGGQVSLTLNGDASEVSADFQRNPQEVTQVDSVSKVNTESKNLYTKMHLSHQSSDSSLDFLVSTVDVQTVAPYAAFDCKEGDFCKSSKNKALTHDVLAYASKAGVPQVTKGQDVTDNATFGKFTVNDLSVLLNDKSTVAPHATVDGPVLGMGNSASDKNLLNQLKASKLVQQRVFAFFFGKSKNFVTLGAYEPYLIKKGEKLAQYPVAYPKDMAQYDGLWRVATKSLHSVEGKTKTEVKSKSDAVFDSTLSHFSAPAAFWAELDAKLKAAKGDLKKLPDLVFQFGDDKVDYTLSGADYAQVKDKACEPINRESTSSDFHFGRAFMARYYTVFDQDNSQVGLAQVNEDDLEDYLMDDNTRWVVIALGLFLILASVAALLAILKPLRNKFIEKTTITTSVVNKQVNQSGLQQSGLRQQNIQMSQPAFGQSNIQGMQSSLQYSQQPIFQSGLANQQRSLSPVKRQ